MSSEGSRYASFSLSQAGTLLYARGGQQSRAQLTWFDRAGRQLNTVGEPASYTTIALSRDDRTVATTFRASTADMSASIHLVDAERGDARRATFERIQDYSPIWSPDGHQLVFVGRRDGGQALNLLQIRTLREEILLRLSASQTASNFRPSDWSRDGRYILGTESFSTSGSMDVWTLSPDTRERRRYVKTSAHESNATFSPDGKWVAYEVAEIGSEGTEIFVRRFPPTDEKHQISISGGVQPLWGADGREISFLKPTGEMALMSAEVTRGEVFQSGPPRRLFAVQAMPPSAVARHYAVSKDGKRFLVAVRRQQPSVPLTVVVNWSSTVK